MKREPGPVRAILGSGSIVAPPARKGLIDEFQVIVNPIVPGEGMTRHGRSRTFRIIVSRRCSPAASGYRGRHSSTVDSAEIARIRAPNSWMGTVCKEVSVRR